MVALLVAAACPSQASFTPLVGGINAPLQRCSAKPQFHFGSAMPIWGRLQISLPFSLSLLLIPLDFPLFLSVR
jgi:hypothetical protein